MEISEKSIDMVVLCGHVSDANLEVRMKYETYDFFEDEGRIPWFKSTGKTISLNGRKLLAHRFSNWALMGEDKPSEVGLRAQDYLKNAPEETEVMLLTWEGSYATRSGSESVIARFYGPVIEEYYCI